MVWVWNWPLEVVMIIWYILMRLEKNDEMNGNDLETYGLSIFLEMIYEYNDK